jgi:hypothetical protein
MSHPHGVQPSCSQDLYSGPDVRSEGKPLHSCMSENPTALFLCHHANESNAATALNARQHAGLGLLHLLSDELLIEILHQLNARDLAKLAVCSRACYAYCQHEDLWKALLLQVSSSVVVRVLQCGVRYVVE